MDGICMQFFSDYCSLFTPNALTTPLLHPSSEERILSVFLDNCVAPNAAGAPKLEDLQFEVSHICSEHPRTG